MFYSGPARFLATAAVYISMLFGASFQTLGLAQRTPGIPTSACWTYRTDENIVAVFTDHSRVYIAKDHARLESISASDGARLWNTDLGGEVISDLVAGTSQVYLSTQNDSGGRVVRSVSSATGITNWVSSFDSGGRVFLGIAGNLLIAVSSDGKVAAFATTDGTKKWLKVLGSPLSAVPSTNPTGLLAGTKDKRIRILSLVDGSEKLNIAAPAEPSAVTANDKDVYWGDDRGNLYAYDVEDGEYRWQSKYGGRITGIVAGPDGLTFASDDNFVYMVSNRYGNLKWKRRLDNRSTGIATWTADYLLVLDASGENADVVDRQKGRLISQLPPPSQQKFTLLSNSSGDHAVLATPDLVSSYRVGGCAR